MFEYSKDGVTVSIFLDTRREKVGGLYPIKIKVTYNRDRKYYPTGKSMTLKQWINLPRSKSPESVIIKQDIENSFSLVKSNVAELLHDGLFSFRQLDVNLGRNKVESLQEAFEKRIQSLTEMEKYGTANVYKYALGNICKFSKNRIGINEVSPELLKKFENYLSKKGLKPPTISQNLRTIRTVLREAMKNRDIKPGQYPFGADGYQIRNYTGRKKSISLSDIRKIEKYQTSNLAREWGRDMWLFIFYCNGINPADVARLKYKDIIDGEIYFIRKKTEDTTRQLKDVIVPITQKIQNIIDKWGCEKKPENYIFPILSKADHSSEIIWKKVKNFNRCISSHIGKIGKELGLGNLNVIIARHSYASAMYHAGVPIGFISESMGHSTISTTHNYLSSFEKKARIKYASILYGSEKAQE